MSDPRQPKQAPRRHVVPGLLVFATFLGLSLAGHARQVARLPVETADDPAPVDPFVVDLPELEDPEDELHLTAEAGEFAPTPAPPPRDSPPPAPPPAAPAELDAPSSSALVLAGLEQALGALAGAGREPGQVMVAVQQARAHLGQVERDLNALRAARVPGLDEAGRAHGRLVRASFEFDSAARRAISVTPTSMGDPFTAPERLVDESRVRLEAARRAMDPGR